VQDAVDKVHRVGVPGRVSRLRIREDRAALLSQDGNSCKL
jgi:hypothetical protein